MIIIKILLNVWVYMTSIFTCRMQTPYVNTGLRFVLILPWSQYIEMLHIKKKPQTAFGWRACIADAASSSSETHLSLSPLPSANSTISTVNKIGIHSTFIYTMHVCHIICETLQGWAWLWQCVMIMMMKSLRVNQARLFASCVSFSTHHICKFVAPTQTTLIHTQTHTHIIRPTAQTQLTRHNQWTRRVWILIHIHTYSSCYVSADKTRMYYICTHANVYVYKCI